MKKRIHTAIRMSPELKIDLEKIAEDREVSLNVLMNQILREYTKKEILCKNKGNG